MSVKKKIITAFVLTATIVIVNVLFAGNEALLAFYGRYIYYPYQAARAILLGWIPFSIGDVLYVLAGALLLLTLARWGYYISKFRGYKDKLAASFLNLINAILGGYLLFIAGWGANYFRQPLQAYWKMPAATYTNKTRAAKRAVDSVAMLTFDDLLVNRLNTYAPHYHTLPLKDINERAKAYYRVYTDSRMKLHGLDIKPTLFGFFMERMAVEGYYNPFTGEGQVNSDLSVFMLPFVVCHEMAHQAGIAAEDDANLMAYAVGTASTDSTFRYSTYLNIWFYAHARVYRRDSVMGKMFEARLNPLTLAHIDTLHQISLKYHHEVARYSSEIYDNYLRLQNQKDGIRSYGNVAYSAWQLEQRQINSSGIIRIP